jgi:hypothetical protein
MTEADGSDLNQHWPAIVAYLHRGEATWVRNYQNVSNESEWQRVSDPLWNLNGAGDTWLGIHPLYQIPPKNVHDSTDPTYIRSQNKYLAGINVVFAEFDLEGFSSAEALCEHVAQLDPPPTVVIASSVAGRQCYWFLADTFVIPVDTDEGAAPERDYIKALQSDWVKRLGGDTGAKDLSRRLRVPGTYNRKPKYAPNYPLVTIITYHPECVYDLSYIEALVKLYRLETGELENKKPPVTGPARSNERLSPGDDYNQRGDFVTELTNAGWRLAHGSPVKQFLGRPGKPRGSVSAIADLSGARCLHVFTSNAPPFEADTTYSPWAVLTFLRFNKDFKASRVWLEENDFGEKPPRLTSGRSLSDAPECDTKPDDAVENPHYAQFKTGIFYIKPKPIYQKGSGDLLGVEYQNTFVCNFQIAIQGELVAADGEEQQTMYTVHGRTEDRQFSFDAQATDLSDERKLKSLLLVYAGGKAIVSAGQMRHMLPAMQSLSNGSYQREVRFVSTGWQKIGDTWIFVTPRGCVGVDEVRCDLSTELRNYRVGQDAAQLPTALQAIKQGLLEAFDHSITYPAVAHAFLPPLFRFMPTVKRYCLHLTGETGTLKTTYATLLCCLYGDFGNEEPTDKWTSTWKSIEVRGYAAKDVLFVVDDYKPRYVRLQDVTELLQGYSDGRGRGRLNRDATLQDTKWIRGAMLSTGEDLPEGEASVLARMVVLKLNRRDGKNHALSLAQTGAKALPAAMGSYIAWLIEHGSQLNIERRLGDKRDAYLKSLSGQSVTNSGRLATNMAQNWLAWQSFSAWMVYVGAWNQTDQAVANETYDQIAPSLLTDLAMRVKAEKASTGFVDAVRSMLDSGEAVLMERNSTSETPHGKLLLGWQDKDGIYMPPGVVFHAVEKWLSQVGQSLGFTNRTLWDQMEADGLLKGRDKTIRTKGESERVKVHHFDLKMLSVPEEEKKEQLPEPETKPEEPPESTDEDGWEPSF